MPNQLICAAQPEIGQQDPEFHLFQVAHKWQVRFELVREIQIGLVWQVQLEDVWGVRIELGYQIQLELVWGVRIELGCQVRFGFP